jgi:anti-sigma-K factor RskA
VAGYLHVLDVQEVKFKGVLSSSLTGWYTVIIIIIIIVVVAAAVLLFDEKQATAPLHEPVLFSARTYSVFVLL